MYKTLLKMYKTLIKVILLDYYENVCTKLYFILTSTSIPHSLLIISPPLSYLTLPTDLNIPLLSSFRASIDINLAMLLILIKLCYRTALFVIEVHMPKILAR